jgi:hypothetical protein
MSRIFPEFEESVNIFTKALQEKGNLLNALYDVGGRGPYNRKTIHALALALARLPIDDLIQLTLSIRYDEIKWLYRAIESKAEDIRSKLEQIKNEENHKSNKICFEMKLDHYNCINYLSLEMAKYEAILEAISWVYEPPLE